MPKRVFSKVKVLNNIVLASSSFFITALSHANCSTTLANAVGDKIVVSGLLTTNDPNENGEGEPVLFSSSGGEFTATVGTYAVPQTYDYVATHANEIITGINLGADGDESCSVTASANPPPFPSPSTKRLMGLVSAGFGGVWAVLGGGAVVCTGTIVGAPCGVALGILSAVAGVVSASAGFIAADPPDSNYNVLASPIYSVIPGLTATNSTDQPLAQAYNLFLSNSEHIIGVQGAFLTSLNRASGARLSNDTVWVTAQTQAAQGFENNLIVLYAKEINLLSTLGSALSAASVDVNVTSSILLNFESILARTGIPQNIRMQMESLGADATALQYIKNVGMVQDINKIAAKLSVALTSQNVLGPLTSAFQSFSGICLVVATVRGDLGYRSTQPGFDPKADLNRDGIVDVRDLAIATKALPVGTLCP